MSAPLSPSARKVQELLDAVGLGLAVVEHEGSTRTSEDAAAAIGCAVAEIAKSLIFRARTSGVPVLVVASGTNRVDEKKVAALIGEKVERATPDFVRDKSGYAIGGVPPIGHAEPPLVLIDDDLLTFSAIWAAAGTPNAVFRLTPDQLVSLTGGRVADVKK
ncbi:prolyl-tRNA editing enzyme YbaK/EbsC (Cys-tRNA(Pro) deacylase) [Azospirillum fermentarium]|uniref:YbaK/EbsC family protein n=1 Tax=Azospirillum fermentarium TaxID=1233114 RepID=UPI0022264887|nr:YbaK/EbsC family protein [Azospirillum fermentarium]MCW2247221.1 prolyl-tRNA editing enzyme YbaK/EbsC (Cys-tRNA(Pro) deacylase) [Azospirillum fermentarium]